MARDIEEFLRRAAQRRQQHLKGGQPAPPARPPAESSAIPMAESVIESPSEDRSFQAKRDPDTSRKSQSSYSSQRKSSKRETSPSRDTDSQRKSKTQKSPIFPSTPSSGQHSRHSQGNIADTSQKFEPQVFQHLDHEQQRLIQVGKSERKQQAGSKESNIQITSQLRNMLARPETVAQAILISEIIKRPSFDDDDI